MQLLVPGCSYCGAYFGWQHLKAQRKRLSGTYRGVVLGLETRGYDSGLADIHSLCIAPMAHF